VLTVGVDVGGTSVRAGVVDAGGAVLDTTRSPTPEGGAPLEKAVVAAVTELTARHPVAAVGLAVAGFVTENRLGVRFAPHLAWRDTPVAEEMTGQLGLPVVLEHDTNAAALAEYRFGAARGAKVAVLVALGTGIGGALLVDGQAFRGAYGVAPELGHLRLVPGGRACPCGKRGCWERYCSGTALGATAVELMATYPAMATVLDGASVTGRRVAAAAREGDPVARRAMAELAVWLGEGFALVADVYDPEVIVVGGGVSESAPLFLDEARQHYAAVVTGAGHRPLARVRTAQLGADAGIVGAATLARDLITDPGRPGIRRPR